MSEKSCPICILCSLKNRLDFRDILYVGFNLFYFFMQIKLTFKYFIVISHKIKKHIWYNFCGVIVKFHMKIVINIIFYFIFLLSFFIGWFDILVWNFAQMLDFVNLDLFRSDCRIAIYSQWSQCLCFFKLLFFFSFFKLDVVCFPVYRFFVHF